VFSIKKNGPREYHDCPCGARILVKNKEAHEKTKRHNDKLNPSSDPKKNDAKKNDVMKLSKSQATKLIEQFEVILESEREARHKARLSRNNAEEAKIRAEEAVDAADKAVQKSKEILALLLEIKDNK
jgi:hypothetical protein